MTYCRIGATIIFSPGHMKSVFPKTGYRGTPGKFFGGKDLMQNCIELVHNWVRYYIVDINWKLVDGLDGFMPRLSPTGPVLSSDPNYSFASQVQILSLQQPTELCYANRHYWYFFVAADIGPPVVVAVIFSFLQMYDNNFQ